MSSSFSADTAALRRLSLMIDHATTDIARANAKLDETTRPAEGVFGQSGPGRDAERAYRELWNATGVAHDQITEATASFGDRLGQAASVMQDVGDRAATSAATGH